MNLPREKQVEATIIWAYQQSYCFADRAAKEYADTRNLDWVEVDSMYSLMGFVEKPKGWDKIEADKSCWDLTKGNPTIRCDEGEWVLHDPSDGSDTILVNPDTDEPFGPDDLKLVQQFLKDEYNDSGQIRGPS